MPAPPSVIFCIERQKLINEFEWAVSEFNRMNSAQVAAVRNGHGFMFAEQIADAERFKENVKYAIIKHQEEHGC
jgi:hypothetical protein